LGTVTSTSGRVDVTGVPVTQSPYPNGLHVIVRLTVTTGVSLKYGDPGSIGISVTAPEST
jgi:hypothetical protein